MIPAEIGGKIALVVGGALIGASTTYFFTKRHLDKKWDALLKSELKEMDDQIAVTRENAMVEAEEKVAMNTYHRLANHFNGNDEPEEKVAPFPTFKDEVDNAHIEWGASDEVESVDIPNRVVKSDDSEPLFSEEPTRDTSKPYVITFDEWFEKEGVDTMRLTYFEEDQIMIDDREEIVYNVPSLLGDEFASFFGWKTDGASDTVFVRNENNNTDYEITREEGSYQSYVMAEHVEEAYNGIDSRSAYRKMRDE